MTMQKQTPYKIRLHIISPVHIGCDDVYEPTGFVVDKATKKLVAFDPVDFVRSLNAADRKKFLELCDKGTLESIVEIYKFMATVNVPSFGHHVDISAGFMNAYESSCRLNTRNVGQLKKDLNQLKVERTSYLVSDNSPYIPGTSLKGALRTGWLNALNQGKIQQIDDRDRKASQKLENMLLDKLDGKHAIESDPFSMLCVSDLLPVGTPDTRICFAVNRKAGRSGGPYQIMEVVNNHDSAVFEGTITIHQPIEGSKIQKAIPSATSFFEHIARFYLAEMDAESHLLKGLKLNDKAKQLFQTLFGDRFMKTVFPVRIGRHSGASSVTIAGARRIKIKNGRPPIQSIATSLWLAGDTTDATSNLLPFGWVALELLELDPTASLYPERNMKAHPATSLPQVAQLTPKPPPPPEQMVWDNAVLVWSPGNQTLTAQCDGKKAEVKLAVDKSLVPEPLHKKLFIKKDTVKAVVTVEKNGNAWVIVGVV
jgi:CRISPR-associated protein Csm5